MADLERDGEPILSEYARDQVCPQCSSRLKIEKRWGYVYCASETCDYVDLAVTGRGQGDSDAIADSAEQSVSASTPPLTDKNRRGCRWD